MFRSIVTALESVDEEGNWVVEMTDPYLLSELPKDKWGAIRWILEHETFGLPLLSIHAEYVKSYLQKVVLEAQRIAEGGWRVKFDTPALLKLPGLDRITEIEELKQFFVRLGKLMEETPDALTTLQIRNERTPNKVTTWSFGFSRRVPPHNGTEEPAIAKILTAEVKANPVLNEYFRQVALSLNKLGPWSWATVTEETIFGHGQGPWHTHRMREVTSASA